MVRKVPKPKTDTIISEVKDNPRVITDETPTLNKILPESIKKSRYKVSLLVPLNANSALGTEEESWSGSTRRFVNYYAGVKLGLKELSREGVQLDVDVYDSKKSLTEVKKLASISQLDRSDVIVGPYDRDAVKWMSDWAKKREVTMLSPWISSTSIAEGNPYYVQLKPGLLQHYQMMLYQAKVQHAGEEVYMILKEGDEKKMRYMNYTLKEIGEDVENPPFERMDLNVDSLTYGQTAFDTTFFKANDCRKTFLVPYASSKDAGFVYDFLRKLQVEQGTCETTVYGMYKWLDYQDEMFDLMNVMDVKLTISNLTNPEDLRVKAFKREYLTEYGALPTDDALEGYDMIKYLGAKLKKYGNRFHLVDEEPYTGLQTVFDVLPETNEEETIDYYQNQFLDLIQIEDFKYDRAYK